MKDNGKRKVNASKLSKLFFFPIKAKKIFHQFTKKKKEKNECNRLSSDAGFKSGDNIKKKFPHIHGVYVFWCSSTAPWCLKAALNSSS